MEPTFLLSSEVTWSAITQNCVVFCDIAKVSVQLHGEKIVKITTVGESWWQFCQVSDIYLIRKVALFHCGGEKQSL